MGYPKVRITNTTGYRASGEVRYASLFCEDDTYTDLEPGATWIGPDRGVCLVTQISAVIKTASQDIWATPYRSSGTSYSLYAILAISDTEFEVTRRTSGHEDVIPADYVEPTEKQK